MVNLRKTALCTAAIILVLLTSVFFAYAAETEVNCEHTDSEFDYICDLCGEDLLIMSGNYGYSEDTYQPSENIKYKLHYDGTLYIYGSGKMNNLSTMQISPFYGKPIKRIIIEDGITSIGNAVFNRVNAEEIVIPDSVSEIGADAFAHTLIKSIELPERLTVIEESCFFECEKLEKIEIPETVKEIKAQAFLGCSALKSITVPEGMEKIASDAFRYCSFDKVTINGDFEGGISKCSVSELVINGAIGEINKKYVHNSTYWDGLAFAESKLVKITITEGATSVGDNVFANSKYLTELNLPEGLETIGESAFRGSKITELDLPSSLKLIDVAAFQDCSALEEVHFSESLTEIGNFAFANCVSLKAIEIPESVKAIGEETFEGCTALTDVVLNEGIESIGRMAFFMCGIKNLSFPASLKDIGDHAFTYNFDLENITVSENNKLYCAENCIIYNKDKTELVAFCNYYDEKIVVPDTVVSTRDDVFVMGGENMLVEHNYPIGLIHSFTLKEIVFEGSLKEIGAFSFAGCINLEKVVLAENTEKLGVGAFCYCLGIEEIDLPESIKYIEGAAFAYCYSLKGIKLPDNVKLGLEAFSYCSSLSDVDLGEGISDLGWYTFAGCGALEELIIPESLKYIEDGAFGYADDPEGFCLKKITFLSTDTVIGMDYDYETGEFVEDVNGDVLPEDCVIYGYKGSTTEEYALAFDREFVAIECQDEHSFNEPEELTKATCTEKGSAKRVCDICKYEETIELAALGHSFGEWYIVSLPDCSSQGKEVRDCLNDNCDYSEENILPVIADAHLDENADGVCDKCEEELEDNKTEPTHCDHLCHSSDAFMSFIWKIVRFFWKLFSMNPTCSCGATHY